MQPKLFSVIIPLVCVLCAKAQHKTNTGLDSFSQRNPLTNSLDDLKNAKNGVLESKNRIIQKVDKLYKNPFQFNGASAEQHGLFDSSYIITGPPSYIGGINFASSWAVLDIPLQVNYQYAKWAGFNEAVSNFSFQYDRDNYLSGLKSKLMSKNGFKNLLPDMQNPWEEVKQNAQELLRNELNGLNAKYNNLLKENISALGPLDGFFNSDIKSLREKLLSPESIKLLQDKESRFATLQNSLNIGESIDRKEYDSLKNALQVYKGLQEIIQVVDKHKKGWESSGLLTKLKEWDVLNKERIIQFINDPSNIITTARQKMNLNGVQRFFLKLNKLNLGQNTANLSPLTVQHFLNKGAATEFLNKNKYLSLLSGNNKRSIPVTDLPFVNSIFPAVNAKSISFGKGKPSKNFTRISVAGYEQGLNSFGPLSELNNLQRSIVTSLSKEFSIGNKGLLTTEISRSVSSYRGSNGNFSSRDHRTLNELFSARDFMSNTAIAVKYQDEVEKAGFNYQVNFKKAANGYNNPGNAFINQGGKEAGFSVRKHFLKRKLQLSLRNDIKEYKYNDNKDEKWRNIYSVMDVKWKLPKGQSVAIRYIPNRMLRIEDKVQTTFTCFDRLSVDANLSKTIRHFNYNNYVSLAYQKNNYFLDNASVGYSALQVNSNQTVVFNKRIFYWNTQLSNSENNSQFVYFNSMLNSDIGTSYSLFKKVQGTTMVGYNSVKDWYKQWGLRQTISIALGESFSADLYVDMRRNIKLYEPLLFGLTRGEINFHYSFNK